MAKDFKSEFEALKAQVQRLVQNPFLIETDMDEVRALLAIAACHAESATADAEQNTIAIADHRQDITLVAG